MAGRRGHLKLFNNITENIIRSALICGLKITQFMSSFRKSKMYFEKFSWLATNRLTDKSIKTHYMSKQQTSTICIIVSHTPPIASVGSDLHPPTTAYQQISMAIWWHQNRNKEIAYISHRLCMTCYSILYVLSKPVGIDFSGRFFYVSLYF